MIRDIALTKYPHEVRLALRIAGRFLSVVDVPIHKKLGHVRFVEALRSAFDKLEDTARHEVLQEHEGWALRIVLNFAIAQLTEAQEGLGRLKREIRQARLPSRHRMPLGGISAG